MKRAILHVDGDGFFAGCEIALDPKLRDQAVVTGAERGIASAMNKKAKDLGITRGMPIQRVRRLFPQVVVIGSEYDTYGLISQRMYAIVRRYTPDVEEYSIDECFADLTGWQRVLGCSYQELAARIKTDLRRELGTTFSVGVAETKCLAKLASKYQKPDGLTVIEPTLREQYLAATPIGSIWGIGYRSVKKFQEWQIITALDFTQRSPTWVKSHLSQPFYDLWRELRGDSCYTLHTNPDDTQKSIQKTRTFIATADKNILWSQLSKNVERACLRARRLNCASPHVYVFLKTQQFTYHHAELKLHYPTALPVDILSQLEPVFHQLYQPNTLYRATGITLADLARADRRQLSLFDDTPAHEAQRELYTVLDQLTNKYGTNIIHLGSSHTAIVTSLPDESRHLIRDEVTHKFLPLPMWGEVT